MKLGLAIFLTDETPGPAELARLAESRGFESLWLPEHTHIPASRESAHPAGIELPREYERTYDPFVALTAAAAATERLRLGMAVCQLAQRDPIVTAKAAASLDRLSGGRLLFGVAPGWNREEMRNHGTDPADRFRVLAERVEAVKRIWTREEASYHGEFVDFERIRCWPKPLQRPHPPVLLGGDGPKVLDRVLAYADGWMPGAPRDDDALLARVAELRERAAAAGRTATVTLTSAPLDPARLERYREAGVERCFFYLPSGSMAEIERRLERIERAAAPLGG